MKPTPKLRFVERPEPSDFNPGLVSTTKKIRILQQWWEDENIFGVEKGEWRDVPLESEERRGADT